MHSCTWDAVKYLWWRFSAKIVTSLKYFRQKSSIIDVWLDYAPAIFIQKYVLSQINIHRSKMHKKKGSYLVRMFQLTDYNRGCTGIYLSITVWILHLVNLNRLSMYFVTLRWIFKFISCNKDFGIIYSIYFFLFACLFFFVRSFGTLIRLFCLLFSLFDSFPLSSNLLPSRRLQSKEASKSCLL